LSEDVGRALAGWAAGVSASDHQGVSRAASDTADASEADRLVAAILATYPPDRHHEVRAYIEGRGGDPAEFVVWLRGQLAKRGEAA
jgi:hypothetical protein